MPQVNNTAKPTTVDGQPTAWHWSLIVVLSLLWGSSFILMKLGLKAYSFTEVASWRILLAFVVLSVFWIRIPFKSISLTDWKYIAVVSIFCSGITPLHITQSQNQYYLSDTLNVSTFSGSALGSASGITNNINGSFLFRYHKYTE